MGSVPPTSEPVYREAFSLYNPAGGYALVCATASLAGYIVLGFTRSTTVGLLTALATLAVAVFVLRARFASETTREPDGERVTG